MRKWVALILAIVMLASTACEKTPDNSVQTSSEEITTAPESISTDTVIAVNGESEYVIVYDAQNNTERQIANDVANFFYAAFGVYLNTRSASSKYDKEIIVGNAGRDATKIVKAQMRSENDYAISAVGVDIVLYATDKTQYTKLLLTLRDFVFAEAEADLLVLKSEKNFIASMNTDMIFNGCEITLVKDSVTDYTIIYGDPSGGDSSSMKYAMYLQKYFQEKFGVRIPIKTDKNNAEHEIILKGSNRDVLKSVNSLLADTDDFTVQVAGDDLVLSATNDKMMILGMMKFISMCTEGKNASTISLLEVSNYTHGREDTGFEYSAKEYCERYQSVYSTYSTRHEEWLQNNWLKNEIKAPADLSLISAMIDRMGKSAVVMEGSSSVLYEGFVKKLDTKDYSRGTKIENGTVKIPREFAEAYFGKTLTADSDGYVDITSYCAFDGAYSLYLSNDGKLAIITPAAIVSFADQSAKVNGYTNKQYCDRMRQFFQSPVFPEPGVNTEQSRVVLEYIQYPDHVLDCHTEQYQTTYSPGIVVVNENGKSVYYVSYEISTIVDQEELSVYTVLKKSADGGETWTTVTAKIPHLRWASPFENKGVIYLIGSDLRNGDAMIAKISSDGKYQISTIAKKAKVSGTAPGSVVHANGRIYKAYLAATLSADENADLMQAASWRLSNKTNSDGLAKYGNEGSMVAGENGKVYQVLHTDKINESIVLELSADGKTYTQLEGTDNGYVYFPTCISKNSVVYDADSKTYISLSNIPTIGEKQDRQRNVLALVVSKDLIHWEIAEYLLVDREMTNPYYSASTHAFQYVDFKIDGNDIVMVVREAAGYTNTYHDGNYCTFYRIDNFRDLLDNARGEYSGV